MRSACAVEKSIYSAEYQQLCLVLKRIREEAGLSQIEVADRLGVKQPFVSKYEHCQRRLDVVELAHVAKALGESLWTVLARLDAEWLKEK